MNTEKIGFISLGCPKNLVDTETMIGQVSKSFEVTNSLLDADIMVLNSCCFIKSATDETVENLSDLKRWKKNNANKKIILTGCFVEEHKSTIFSDFPFVDGILNTGALSEISTLVSQVISSENNSSTEILLEKEKNLLNQEKRTLTTPSHYAYLKIGDGCNHACSFCKIPYLRGKAYFKEPSKILEEASLLSNKGVKEIILIAQDISNYSFGEKYALSQLLEELENIEKIEWIRLLYLNPDNINENLIKTIKSSKKIVKYIDMPIQHISDKILKAMNRKSSKKRIIDLIDFIKNEIPNVKLRTTVLTGFPGEDENDFNELHSFIQEQRFDHLGVFAYSDEKNTVAFNMEGKLKEQTKEKRVMTLQKTQKRISKKNNEQYLGQKMEILIDGLSGGRRYFDSPEIDGFVYVENLQKKDIGTFKSVTIKKALHYDLIGTVT
jgi:ribosomal protein S12 methylthiotransferase